VNGRLLAGAMAWSAKAADLRPDPRYVLHSTLTGPDSGAGELKLHRRAGQAGPCLRGQAPGAWWSAQPPGKAIVFVGRIGQALFVAWDLEHGEMTVHRWSPQAGYRQATRTYPWHARLTRQHAAIATSGRLPGTCGILGPPEQLDLRDVPEKHRGERGRPDRRIRATTSRPAGHATTPGHSYADSERCRAGPAGVRAGMSNHLSVTTTTARPCPPRSRLTCSCERSCPGWVRGDTAPVVYTYSGSPFWPSSPGPIGTSTSRRLPPGAKTGRPRSSSSV
jgi:hypothetical protein